MSESATNCTEYIFSLNH